MDKIENNTNIRSVEIRRGKDLWAKTPHRDAAEFTDMRYTAVDCAQPIEFDKYGYKIRCGENGRSVKCFIVVTMYAEDDEELDGTLRGVCANIKNFPEYDDIAVSWQEIAVCIVSDGRLKANAKCLEYAEDIGIFDKEILYKYGNPGQKPWGGTWDTYMHMFEYSPQLKEDKNFEKCFPPMQVMFGLKERNGGKLDSHLWFFNAFSNHLIPKYTFLLDVGTIARPRSICKLYQAMERDPQIAGCCGEIACFKPDYLNPVEAAQHFEYKMSHILDKSTEACFGYISVLPGAFSAYRYEAIRPGEDGTGPLVDYFKSITASMKILGPFKANMYLAEDRILCYEIIARNDCNWILYYVKNAIAETDVPNTLHDLVKQRRRWLNGSFFAMLYAILNFNRFWTRSTHSLSRKIAVTLQFVTYVLNIFLNWFLVGTFYIAFILVVDQAMQSTMGTAQKTGANGIDKCDYKGAESLSFVFSYVYMFLTLVQFICGLGNKPDKMSTVYSFCSLFYGIFTLFTVMVVTLVLADGTNAAWQCENTPRVISCNEKDVCIPGVIPRDIPCQEKAPSKNSETISYKCNQDPEISWECLCLESDVGQNRFADCQTLCASAPIKPQTLRWSTIGALSSYFVGALIHGEFWHILFSILQYYYMLPTFINIFSIYSFCNVHDISWGTKGIEAAHGGAEAAVKKKGGAGDDEDRPRGETAQREADAKQLIIKEQREKSIKDALDKDRGNVEASFQAFRSYLVIAWVASNALYVGIMQGYMSVSVDSSIVPAYFNICTEQQAIQLAMTQGMGYKGGAWTPSYSGINTFKSLSGDTIKFDNPPGEAYGADLNIGKNSFLIEIAKTLTEAQCTGGSSQPVPVLTTCKPIEALLTGAALNMTPAQFYMIALFVLVAYTLGLKMFGCALYLILRKIGGCYHQSANKKRRNYEIRRQEMAHVESPLQELSRAAVLAGWSAQVDPQTGRTYYQNTRTNQTSWELPEEE